MRASNDKETRLGSGWMRLGVVMEVVVVLDRGQSREIVLVKDRHWPLH